MSEDPLYGPDVEHDEVESLPNKSDAVVREQVAEVVRQQTRSPRDRSLKHPRRDR